MRAQTESRSRSRARRGLAIIAVVVVLVIVDLIIVRTVIGGARDHDLTVRRIETVRAFYAAEAGMNMGIREMMLRDDQDSDGTIGSISDDGDDGTDPSIGGSARVVVTTSVAGSRTTLTSTGRCGIARRKVESLLEE